MTTATVWLDRALQTHVQLAALITVALIAIWWVLPEPALWVEAAFLVTLVCTLGLPHGALDYVAGREIFQPRFRTLWPLAFSVSYLGLAALVIAAWMLEPGIWLAVMLTISAVHFGLDDSSPRLTSGMSWFVEILGRGGAVIVVPSALHTEDVARIFGFLLPGLGQIEIAMYMESGLVLLGPLVAAGLVIAIFLHATGWFGGSDKAHYHRDTLSEILSIVAVFAVLPPLLAFTLYFCLWHSFRQILIVSARSEHHSPGRALLAFARVALFPTCTVVMVLAFAWLIGSRQEESVPALISAVFVSLFALTLPHMILQEAYKRLAIRSDTGKASNAGTAIPDGQP